MRAFLVILVIWVLCLVPRPVCAESSVNIGVTALGQESDNLDITNTPDSYAFGFVHISDVVDTGFNYFTVTNVGNVDLDISVSGEDLTGDVVPKIWTLSDNATPDYETYGLAAGLPSGYLSLGFASGDEWTILGFVGGDEQEEGGEGGSYSIIIKKTPAFNVLVYTLGITDNVEWGFEALFPVSGLGNENMAGHVVLTATKST